MPNTTVLTSGENKSKYTDNLNFKYQGHGKIKYNCLPTKYAKPHSLYKSMSWWPTAKSLDFLPNLLTFQTPEDFGSMDSDVGLEKGFLKTSIFLPHTVLRGVYFCSLSWDFPGFSISLLGLSWTSISLSRHFKRKKQTYYPISKH